MRPPPDEVMWLIALISMVLPVAGILFVIYGAAAYSRGWGDGAWWFWLGAGLIVLDYLIDIWLGRFVDVGSEVPDLNARGVRHVGRIVLLEQPISAGRGRIRLNDSWWTIEGPDMAAGEKVRIVGVRGAVLVVAPL